MAKLRCHASTARVWSLLREACERQNYSFREYGNQLADVRYSILKLTYTLSLAASPTHAGGTLLEIDAAPTNVLVWTRRILWSSGFVSILLLLSAARASSETWILHGSALALICSAALVQETVLSRQCDGAIAALLGPLRIAIRTRQQTAFGIRLPTFDAYVLLPLGIIVLGLVMLQLLGLVLGSICALFLLSALGALVVGRRNLGNWRGALHAVHVGWVSICKMSFLALTVICLLGLTVQVFHEEPPSSAREMLLRSDSLLQADIQSFNQPTATSPVASLEQEVRAGSVDLERAAAPLLILFLAGLATYGFMVSNICRGVMRHVSTIVLGHRGGETMVDPPARFTPWNRAAIVANALVFGLVHALYAALSVDAIASAWFGSAILLTTMDVSIEIARLLLSAIGLGSAFTNLLPVVLTSLFALPGIVLLVGTVWRIVQGTLYELMHTMRAHSIDASPLREHATHVHNLARQLNVEVPKVVVQNSSDTLVYAECAWFGSSRLVLSAHRLTILTCEEMRGILAHEMYHLAKDAAVLGRLRIGSVLLLSPMFYLSILYDFAWRERRADQFAISVIENLEIYRSALAKLYLDSAMDLSTTDASKWSAPLVQRVWAAVARTNTWRVLSLLFSNAIIGGGYPSLAERLAWLDAEVRGSNDMEGRQ